MFEIFKQGDKRWASVHLGGSPLTIGRYGCTTSCIAMATQKAGHTLTPDQIAHNAANYTADGLILWSKLRLDGLSFKWRDVGYFPNKIDAALADPQNIVLFEVNNGSHWILAERKAAGDYLSYDPWYGDSCGALARYHNITKTVYFRITDPVIRAEIMPDDLNRLRGKFLIGVEQGGRLWYVSTDGTRIDLGGTPNEMQTKIAKLAIGIKNADLFRIPQK